MVQKSSERANRILFDGSGVAFFELFYQNVCSL